MVKLVSAPVAIGDDRCQLIDREKWNSAITRPDDLGYVGRIRNRDLLGVKVAIYRHGYQCAVCPRVCILTVGSVQNAIGEANLAMAHTFLIRCVRHGRVSRAVSRSRAARP